jgi:hypothetical protein
MADARRIVDLGRAARSTSGVKLRQPLARLVVEGASPADELVSIVRDELRVKEVALGHVESELVVKPNLPILGPKLGASLGAVRSALAAGEFEDLGGGRFRAAGHELSPEEVLVERSGRDGWAIASADGVTVALDTTVDEGLEREARVYELIHQVNTMRKEAGFALTDRIALTIPSGDADLLEHADWVKADRCDSASCSSRRSSTGRRKVTSSSTIRWDSIRSTPWARNQSQTRVTSRSGADAPDVIPTVSIPSSHASSISASSSIRCDGTPDARATSTSRFEFDEFREPITSSRSISPSMSFTAHWRLEVA